jgi:perosamine synthetase
MIVTGRDDVAKRVSKQRAFGIDKSVLADRRHTGAYEVELLGLNYRLGEVAAAIGVEQMRRLPGWLHRRERNFRMLARGVSRIDDVTVLDTDDQGALRSAHYCLGALLAPPLAKHRESIIDGLKGQGVGTSVYYPRSLPDTRYYRETYGYPHGSCPVATRISSDSIAFPVGPHVREGDIDRMTETFRTVLEEVAVRA